MGLCLFDFDGTLFDTIIPTVRFLREQRRSTGCSALRIHEDYVASNWGPLAAWSERVGAVLDRLATKGMVLEVISGSHEEIIAVYLAVGSLHRRFRHVHGSLRSGEAARDRLIDKLAAEASDECWLVTDNREELIGTESRRNVRLVQPLWFGGAAVSVPGVSACEQFESLPILLAGPQDTD